MLITTNASIGFLGDAMFGVSPFSSTLQTWSDACMQVESDQLHSSCSKFPANVETYFNSRFSALKRLATPHLTLTGFRPQEKFTTRPCVSVVPQPTTVLTYIARLTASMRSTRLIGSTRVHGIATSRAQLARSVSGTTHRSGRS